MNKFISINIKPFYQRTKDILDENIPNNEYNLYYTSKGVSKKYFKTLTAETQKRIMSSELFSKVADILGDILPTEFYSFDFTFDYKNNEYLLNIALNMDVDFKILNNKMRVSCYNEIYSKLEDVYFNISTVLYNSKIVDFRKFNVYFN